MIKKFSPGVVVDGHCVDVPGWLWTLAFALRGVKWAVAEVSKPEFQALIENQRCIEEQYRQDVYSDDIFKKCLERLDKPKYKTDLRYINLPAHRFSKE